MTDAMMMVLIYRASDDDDVFILCTMRSTRAYLTKGVSSVFEATPNTPFFYKESQYYTGVKRSALEDSV
jgi:hypothetical protein